MLVAETLADWMNSRGIKTVFEKRFKDEEEVYFLTLNLKYNYSIEKCEKIFDSFIENVNKGIYKNAFRRYGKCINHIAILDGGKDEVIRHYHVLVAKCHRYETMEEFGNFLFSKWKEIPESNKLKYGTDIRIANDVRQGIFYSLKDRTKELGNGIEITCHIHPSSYFYK